MTELISTINEIVKYGLKPNLNSPDRDYLLEKHLITIYKLYFELQYEEEDRNYPDFDKSNLPNIHENVISNFPGFGFYKIVLDINKMTDFSDIALGDAIDDLNDIIIDLLEIKWRIENNSLNNGIYYFKLLFPIHIKPHVLGLLTFLNEKED